MLTGAFASTVQGHTVASETPHSGVVPSLFDPMHFGATGDGRTLDSSAINAAIDACARSGGGVVYLRPGVYRSGTLHLKSNVTLYLEAGSVIRGSLELNDYDEVGEIFRTGNTKPRSLIYAKEADNVCLAGPGRIDGQGSHFWQPSGRPPASADNEWAEVASLAWRPKDSGRPSPMLQFVKCRWLKIEDLRIENSPGWTVSMINCENVSIQGVTIKNPITGINTDGLDMDGCQNVFISNCSIETGDDAICLKSEDPTGEGPRLARNITVTNCVLTTCCNGFKIGIGSIGGFENITFSNSAVYSDPGALKNRVISGIALEVVDGGWIEGVAISGIQMQRTRTPIFIRLGERSQPRTSVRPRLRGVMIDGIQASETVLASSITGVPELMVEDVSLSNIRIENVLPARQEWIGHVVPEMERGYPEARMFGMLPVSGLYARHVRGLKLADISLAATAGETRPAIMFDQVNGARITGFTSAAIVGAEPLIKVTNTKDTWISGASAPAKTGLFLAVEGAATDGLVVSNCDLHHAEKGIQIDGSVLPSAVFASGNLST
ncbi:glycoside hydrolase family 28 protein [Terriglobus albidus]|uniref:glycoside hydrolase family 28 protein n=1 Tax=Terriglobus albidus TaxID=1592106 RepID=UPI0021E0410C|nr:glycoside hydrolase family 28 protein [Terriglobus albidus]